MRSRNSIVRFIKNSPSINYLRYLLRHKYWVAKLLFQHKMYWQGITHDMSKFRPDEFKRYARYYATNKQSDIREQWLHHMNRNKHHWQYWVLMDHDGNMQAIPMPEKYIIEMLADWYSVAVCESNTDDIDYYVFKWYSDRRNGIYMHKSSKEFLEKELEGQLNTVK